MCGIAGVLAALSPSVVDEDALERAAVSLRHRGPDGSRTWTRPGFGLAHTRLAIIDRAHGDQPMFSEDGRLVVVFNGEIYNHRELRSSLEAEGCRFRTNCDTEVLLHLFRRDGSGMVDRLRGMFAFCVVDLETEEAVLARDRFGVKPLTYTVDGTSLRFASTLDALRPLLGATPGLDRRAIADYLALQYVPSPRTPYEDVSQLPPGHLARWSRGSLSIDRYWRPPARGEGSVDVSTEDSAEHLRSSLGEAVRIRLESEVPLGVFLSGGLDSSAVVAEIARAGIQPRTYCVGFRDARLDETRYARAVAERFDARHTELVADTAVGDLFDLFTAHYDAPFADSSALATLAVARAATDHVTVVLTGDGGDELFGGYERYLRYRQAVRIHDRMGPLSGPASAASRLAGKALRLGRVSRGSPWVADPWTGYRDALFHHPPSEVARLLGLSRIDSEAPLRRLDGLRNAADGGPLGLAWIDQMTYLPDDLLTKADRATMAFGLEARSPFLDHRLAEWAATLPESLLWDPAGGKRILREAYRDELPAEILTRPKMGFGVPIASWMRAELRPCVDTLLLDAQSPVWSVLSFGEGSRMVRRFLNGDSSRTYRTWNLLALAGWARDRLGS